MPWWGLTAPGWWVQPDRCLIDEQFALGSSGRRRSHDGGWLKDKTSNQMFGWVGKVYGSRYCLAKGTVTGVIVSNCNMML